MAPSPSQSHRLKPGGGPGRVPGFRVGHAQDLAGPTGCSVVLCPPETVGGVAVRGSAAGGRQMDALYPGHLVDQINAVLFTGGSAFGLGAPDGVVDYLAGQGQGMGAGSFRVPIVPTAVIFDLPLNRDGRRPDAEMARQACHQAHDGDLERGNLGAGAGATVGKLFGVAQATKGGLGGAVFTVGKLILGALVVVNAFGDVKDAQGRIIAGARSRPDGREFADTSAWFLAGNRREGFEPPQNTTLAVVASNARLDKNQACKVAALAHHGLVRAIEPVHTRFDGDLVVVLSHGEQEADLNGLGLMASRLLFSAVQDAVLTTEPLAGLPAARQLKPRPSAK